MSRSRSQTLPDSSPEHRQGRTADTDHVANAINEIKELMRWYNVLMLFAYGTSGQTGHPQQRRTSRRTIMRPQRYHREEHRMRFFKQHDGMCSTNLSDTCTDGTRPSAPTCWNPYAASSLRVVLCPNHAFVGHRHKTTKARHPSS